MGLAIFDRAYRAGATYSQNWSNENGLAIDTLQYGANFAGGVWTCPVQGTYRFTVCSIMQNNTGASNEMGVGVYFAALGVASGMELARVAVPNSGYGQFNGTITQQMSAGQTAQAFAFSGSNAGFGCQFYVGANPTIQGQWMEAQRV